MTQRPGDPDQRDTRRGPGPTPSTAGGVSQGDEGVACPPPPDGTAESGREAAPAEDCAVELGLTAGAAHHLILVAQGHWRCREAVVAEEALCWEALGRAAAWLRSGLQCGHALWHVGPSDPECPPGAVGQTGCGPGVGAGGGGQGDEAGASDAAGGGAAPGPRAAQCPAVAPSGPAHMAYLEPPSPHAPVGRSECPPDSDLCPPAPGTPSRALTPTQTPDTKGYLVSDPTTSPDSSLGTVSSSPKGPGLELGDGYAAVPSHTPPPAAPRDDGAEGEGVPLLRHSAPTRAPVGLDLLCAEREGRARVCGLEQCARARCLALQASRWDHAVVELQEGAGRQRLVLREAAAFAGLWRGLAGDGGAGPEGGPRGPAPTPGPPHAPRPHRPAARNDPPPPAPAAPVAPGPASGGGGGSTPTSPPRPSVVPECPQSAGPSPSAAPGPERAGPSATTPAASASTASPAAPGPTVRPDPARPEAGLCGGGGTAVDDCKQLLQQEKWHRHLDLLTKAEEADRQESQVREWTAREALQAAEEALRDASVRRLVRGGPGKPGGLHAAAGGVGALQANAMSVEALLGVFAGRLSVNAHPTFLCL